MVIGKTSVSNQILFVFVWVWMGVGRPCPPIHKDVIFSSLFTEMAVEKLLCLLHPGANVMGLLELNEFFYGKLEKLQPMIVSPTPRRIRDFVSQLSDR